MARPAGPLDHILLRKGCQGQLRGSGILLVNLARGRDAIHTGHHQVHQGFTSACAGRIWMASRPSRRPVEIFINHQITQTAKDNGMVVYQEGANGCHASPAMEFGNWGSIHASFRPS